MGRSHDSERTPGSVDISRRVFTGGAAAALGTAWAATVVGGRRVYAAAPHRPVGVAVVGLGRLAIDQILPALRQTKLCRLAALVSGHPDKARRIAGEYGLPEKNVYTYESYDTIAQNPAIEMVYIVLPNSMHAEYSIRAAKAGKHVLCEKPMAISSRECEQMIAASREAKRQLAVAYRLHYDPYNRELVRIARQKELGSIKVITAAAGFNMAPASGQWRLDKKLAGGGSLMDMGIYALQAARTISGEEPIAIMAQETLTKPDKFKGIDETILFTLRFPSGVIATCTSSYSVNVNRYEVAADWGRFGVDPAQWYQGIKGFRTDGKPFEFPYNNHFLDMMDDFASCIRERRTSRIAGEEGLRDLRIIEAIYKAAATGREVRMS